MDCRNEAMSAHSSFPPAYQGRVGNPAIALVELYTEVYWRPGGRGERQARLEFEGAIESSHTTADAFDTLALRTLSLE